MLISSSPPRPERRRNRQQFEEDIDEPDLPPHSKHVRPSTPAPGMHTLRRSPRKLLLLVVVANLDMHI
jgi:hypothetical protein